MSLFPDRQLASASSSELALVSPSLTDEQKRQLSSVTEGYLKDHRLIGFENTRAALPVIKQCVVDALQGRHKRENILPADNLQAAFRKGYADRTALIKTMESELEGLQGETRLEGALALPQDLVKSAARELRGRIFLPKLKAGQEVAEIAKVRRPIFKHLIDYGRSRVEEDIPGSKQAKLSPQQEAGLVRHLVFGWATFGEPRLLLETEDFMAYRQVYLAEIAQEGDTLWKDLAQMVGQDSPEAIAYLKDMSTQVADLLASVPDKPSFGVDALAVASSIDTAFKGLERHFLVVNPFNKLPSLSEDPRDEGRSIWDNNRSITAIINGFGYRLPTISTLNLAAYLISGEKPTRAQEYRNGGRKVASLIEELGRQSHDRSIPNLEDEIEKDQQTLERLRKTIIRGSVPIEGAMTPADILRLAQNQHGLMLDEMQFISTVRDYHRRFTELSLDLIRRYQDGDPLRSDSDFGEILTVHYSPGLLRERVLYFARERMAKRIRSLEELVAYENFTDAMMSDASTDYAKTRFQESLDVTVLDVLAFRNRFWLGQYLKPRPELSPSQLGMAWGAILTLEERRIESEAWRRASFGVAPTDRYRIEARKERILSNPVDPLARQNVRIKRLTEDLKAGVVPSDESIFQRYLKQWKEEGDKKITSAMYEWTDEERITLPLREKLDKEGGIDARKLGDPQSLRNKTEQSNGPLAVVLGALSRIGPPQLLPDYPVNIEDVAHRVYWEDDSDPFSHTRPGVGSRQELDRKRHILYARFQDWLAANGIYLGEDTFKDLIKPGDMSELITSGNAYHRLFGIEGELQIWYGNQRRKLMAQVREHPSGFYNTSPASLVYKREFGLSSKQKSLASLRRRDTQRLDGRVGELRQLGLIKAEESKSE